MTECCQNAVKPREVAWHSMAFPEDVFLTPDISAPHLPHSGAVGEVRPGSSGLPLWSSLGPPLQCPPRPPGLAKRSVEGHQSAVRRSQV